MLKRIWKNGRGKVFGEPSKLVSGLFVALLIDVAFTIWHGLVCAADSGLDASLGGCGDKYRRSVHGSVPLASSRFHTLWLRACDPVVRDADEQLEECVATESLDRRNRPVPVPRVPDTNTLTPLQLYSTSMAKHETAQQDQTKLERATILVSRHLSIEYGHNQRASMPTIYTPIGCS